MNINIKATNMELTQAIKNYVNEKIFFLNKFITQENLPIFIEVGKTTNHHNKGEVYKAEIRIELNGETFYSNVEGEDLYTSIDEVRDEIARKLRKSKGRNITLYRRGAKSVKKMIKGLSNRNPFTSKKI